MRNSTTDVATGLTSQSRAKGFSLVELMVSLVLGVIITGGAISVYIAAKRSFTEVEQVASVSENGRFALSLLGMAMRHVGFFGGSFPADIREHPALGAVTGDCSGSAAAYDMDNAFFALNTASADVFSCITDAMPGTDVLVLKGVEARPVYDADPDDPDATRDGALSFTRSFPTPPATMDEPWSARETYIVANNDSGILVDGADTPPGVGEGAEFAQGAAWPYRFQIYYVRNGAVPTLSRKFLAWDTVSGTMSIQTQDLVQGVENLRFRFGVDSDNTGDIDSFASAAEVDTDNAWGRVISMQVFVLVRTALEDPAYTNQKTYQIDSVAVTPSDRFRRVLLNSEIALRNPRLVLRGGA